MVSAHTENQASSDAGTMRELWRVAFPLMLSSGSVSLMLVVDRLYMWWYSQDAIAAATPAGLMHWTIISLPFGVAMYANTFVAQYGGAGRKDRVVASIWQAVFVAIVAGLLMLVPALFARQIFAAIGHPDRVQQLESVYFAILSAGSMPIILAQVLSCFFGGRGKTRVVMWVNIAATAFNIVFDYFMIFGIGSLPGLGMAGAAIATVCSGILQCVLYVWLISRDSVAEGYAFRSHFGLDRELMNRLLRYGVPNGTQFFIDVAGFSIFIMFVGRLGTAQLAATNVAFNLNTLAFVPMMGLGIAVSILVGMRIGEGRPDLAVKTTWTACWLASVYMGMFMIIYLALPHLLLRPYAAYVDPADFAAISHTVVVLLRFLALFAICDGFAIIFGFAVKGAGDTRFAMVFSLFASIFLLVLPTIMALEWLGGGLISCFVACTVYISVLGIGFMIRFHKGKWKSMRVIELQPEPEVDDSDLVSVDSDLIAQAHDVETV